MVANKNEGVIMLEPVSVDVGSVEKELTGLWAKAVGGEFPGTTTPMAKVLVLNLLVYAATDDEADDAREVISEIAASHPARIVIADAQPGTPEKELKADVSMLCNIGERGRTLCGEEIRLHVHGLSTAALGTVIPTLAPDLPIYLWTPGELVNSEVLRQLAYTADHWIIDFRRFPDWIEGLKMIVSLGPNHEKDLILHDLAWVSLLPWREVIAQHFDAAPTHHYLHGISEIKIKTGQSGWTAPKVEGVLMAAWLIRELGWQDAQLENLNNGKWKITAQAGAHPVSILIQTSDEATRAVSEIIIEADADGGHAAFISTVTRDGEINIHVEAPDLPGARRTVRPEFPSRSQELSQALDAPGRDVLFESVLPIVERLARRIQDTT